MIKRSCLIFTAVLLVVTAGSLACAQQPQSANPQKTPNDSMESMNERGDKVMGFDHTKTTHHFLLKTDGGVIQIEANDNADTASRDEIRMHMKHIAKMFGEGNFSAPMLIHEQDPPGADVMKQLKAKIKYEFGENERGAFIRISTGDAEALNAIHEFLRFQITEHMTGDPLEVRATKQ
ncbi:MAG: hypothetical protein DMF71_01060 [Acidobacteria bacterium]|nr:MAG: hypothetical protein DMF71_01060 [Acidobacteriota bacterium]